ncbi:MAG: hypothetical protein IJK52_01935 [Oscillospiraceae bacterium]|nr:hypothetical protein [Oscillospiraceae bacterium]
MNCEAFFEFHGVAKGKTVYVLDRRETSDADGGGSQCRYEIEEWTVVSAGRLYLTARCGGRVKEQFERLPSVHPWRGICLESTQFRGTRLFRKKCFPTRELAEKAKTIFEKADAGKAQART